MRVWSRSRAGQARPAAVNGCGSLASHLRSRASTCPGPNSQPLGAPAWPVGDRSGPGTEISAARPETLESNLLPVVLPPLVYSAPCTAGEDREVHETLREAYQYQ